MLSGLVDRLSGILKLGTRTSVDSEPGSSNSAGEYIDDNTALALSAVWACVNLLAGTTATLPLMVYKPEGAGRVPAKDHPLYRILHDDPNADQTDVDFWEYSGAALELRGNAFAEKIRGSAGQLVGLEPIPPSIMSTRIREDGEIGYRWTLDGKSHDKTSRDVLHIRGFGGGKLGGLSTLTYASETFGLSRSQNRTIGHLNRNSIRASGVYQTPTKLTRPQRQEIEDALAKRMAGVANAGRPMVIGHDLKWQALTINPVDVELLASRGFSIEEICRFFGVPPFMIGHNEKNSGYPTSLESQLLLFEKFSLRRRLNRIEKALRKQLLTAEDIARGITIEFVMEGLLRADSETRAKFYTSGLQNGWMTINEVRAKENLPPVTGGDVPRMQMQNIPITMTPDGKLAATPASY